MQENIILPVDSYVVHGNISDSLSEDEEHEEGPRSSHQDDSPVMCSGRVSRLSLTEEQEVSIVEWYRQNPLFYDKSERDYKNRDRRDAMLNEKARELSITGMVFI